MPNCDQENPIHRQIANGLRKKAKQHDKRAIEHGLRFVEELRRRWPFSLIAPVVEGFIEVCRSDICNYKAATREALYHDTTTIRLPQDSESRLLWGFSCLYLIFLLCLTSALVFFLGISIALNAESQSSFVLLAQLLAVLCCLLGAGASAYYLGKLRLYKSMVNSIVFMQASKLVYYILFQGLC